MTHNDSSLPKLHVEGKDDVSVISNLLARHGIITKTDGAYAYLEILACGGEIGVLSILESAIKSSTDRPVGFVIDIDEDLRSRWQGIVERLQHLGVDAPSACPREGYIGKISDYPHGFGIWLMPDCQMDSGKLEDFVATLVPAGNPLWPFATECVDEAAVRTAAANTAVANQTPVSSPASWECFREVDRGKAERRTWLAWQRPPGVQLGAAINNRVLNHDSEIALRFLDWLKRLYAIDPSTT